MLYRLDAPARDVARLLGAEAGNDPWTGGTVSPGQFAPVITAGREEVAGPRPQDGRPKRLIPRLWGVPPPRSVQEAPARGILTVRNLESPFWIGNLRNCEFRCLIPATAFMEWGHPSATDGKRRQQWFSCADQPLFAMAGVWKDSEIPSFALLTCAPNAALREAGKDAMPVILPPDPAVWDMWLNGRWDRAQALVAPYASSLMRVGHNGT